MLTPQIWILSLQILMMQRACVLFGKRWFLGGWRESGLVPVCFGCFRGSLSGPKGFPFKHQGC